MPVGDVVALVGNVVAPVGVGVALVGDAVGLIGVGVALVGDAVALVGVTTKLSFVADSTVVGGCFSLFAVSSPKLRRRRQRECCGRADSPLTTTRRD